jgi:hypothetical protein
MLGAVNITGIAAALRKDSCSYGNRLIIPLRYVNDSSPNGKRATLFERCRRSQVTPTRTLPIFFAATDFDGTARAVRPGPYGNKGGDRDAEMLLVLALDALAVLGAIIV